MQPLNPLASLHALNILNFGSFGLPPLVLWILFGLALIGTIVMSATLWFHWSKYGLNTLPTQLVFFAGTGILLFMALSICTAYGARF